MTPETPTAIAVIGPGRIGRSFHAAASAAGAEVVLAGRDDASRAAEACDVALLCVPDAEIGPAAEMLAKLPGCPSMVGHTSGATGLAELEPVRRTGARTFTLHPLQTVPDGETSLTGAPCAISGSSQEALAEARRLGELVEMRPFEIDDDARAAYHAAASIASNFLVALEQSATELLELAGVENGRELLSPLVLQTAANWADRGSEALTGPIARGDAATVDRHLAAITELHPELLPLYESLAERTRAIASGLRAGSDAGGHR